MAAGTRPQEDVASHSAVALMLRAGRYGNVPSDSGRNYLSLSRSMHLSAPVKSFELFDRKSKP